MHEKPKIAWALLSLILLFAEVEAPSVEVQPTPTVTATPTKTVTPPPPTPTPLGAGYFLEGLWIPGWISEETWRTEQPEWTIGNATFYANGLMKATARVRGMDLTDFVGGVSLFSPEDIGDVVWLKPPFGAWEGPYLVVDCAEQDHMYAAVVHKGEVVEISWDHATRWGLVVNGKIVSHRLDGVQVSKIEPSQLRGDPVNYKVWFLTTLQWVGWTG